MEQKRHKVLRNLVSKKLNLILIFAHFSVFCCYRILYSFETPRNCRAYI